MMDPSRISLSLFSGVATHHINKFLSEAAFGCKKWTLVVCKLHQDQCLGATTKGIITFSDFLPGIVIRCTVCKGTLRQYDKGVLSWEDSNMSDSTGYFTRLLCEESLTRQAFEILEQTSQMSPLKKLSKTRRVSYFLAPTTRNVISPLQPAGAQKIRGMTSSCQGNPAGVCSGGLTDSTPHPRFFDLPGTASQLAGTADGPGVGK